VYGLVKKVLKVYVCNLSQVVKNMEIIKAAEDIGNCHH
jgi:hypothetical protein